MHHDEIEIDASSKLKTGPVRDLSCKKWGACNTMCLSIFSGDFQLQHTCVCRSHTGTQVSEASVPHPVYESVYEL
jgi:hypothetical protein